MTRSAHSAAGGQSRAGHEGCTARHVGAQHGAGPFPPLIRASSDTTESRSRCSIAAGAGAGEADHKAVSFLSLLARPGVRGMPKLSAYVAASSSAAEPGQQQQPAPAGSGGGAALVAAAAPLEHGDHQLQQGEHLVQRISGTPIPVAAGAASRPAAQGSAPAGSGGAHQLDPQHEAAAAKLAADYSKRLREHGLRTYRWPDGSLRPDRPPPNPHAVVSEGACTAPPVPFLCSAAAVRVQASSLAMLLTLNLPLFAPAGQPAAVGAAGAALPYPWRRPCL